MSDDPGRNQISEEELRAYLAELREAPLSDVVAQTISVLLNAAQVKLGRPDGRTLIDIVAAVRDAAGDQLDQRLVQELDNALSQLRLAQVEAEQGAPPSTSDAGGADAPTATSQGDAGTGAGGSEGQGGQAGEGGASSRLWVPGRS